MMEAIILAGGFGTRLRETISDLPKPMAPIAGRPFLEILLSFLTGKGFRRFILSLGWMANIVIDHFGDEFRGSKLVYVIEKEPLGTGGATRLAMQHVSADHVFVFNGDTFLDLEVEAVEQLWQATRLPVIVGRKVEDTSRYGLLYVENGRVVGFAEKRAQVRGLISAGCCVLSKDQLEAFPIGSAFSLETDFLAKAVKTQHFSVFATEGTFIDIGTPEDYEKAQTMLAFTATTGDRSEPK